MHQSGPLPVQSVRLGGGMRIEISFCVVFMSILSNNKSNAPVK